MNKLHLFFSLVAVIASTGLSQTTAVNIGETEARMVVCRFMNHRATTGIFKAPNLADLTLAHVERSAVVANANDYYAYNVTGDGWVIVAGDDRAVPVLGYSDHGHLDFEHLPCGFKALTDGYKREMNQLRAHCPEMVPVAQSLSAPIVAPLTTTTWGQEMPYNLQCPTSEGQHCRAGCVAVAMAQVMKFWQYPQSCGTVASYYSSKIGTTLPALPPTTFDYNLMLGSYCHWDWANSLLIQDPYTDQQAQEVAKLMRYCGQAAKMTYGAEASSAQVAAQFRAIKDFGFRSTAKDVRHDLFGVSLYNIETWESMMRQELDEGRPILYSALDLSEGAHAFVCDGYDGEGLFHFNMGWYGNCDGWYVVTALKMSHPQGYQLDFVINHEMLTGIEPPEGWEPPTHEPVGDLDGNGRVDIDDLNLLVNLLLELDVSLSPGVQTDLNGDHSVDIADVNLLVNIILAH